MAAQAAWGLNCQPHDAPIPVAARRLKPPGNPPPNGIRFFAASELPEPVKDRAGLVKVTNAVNQHLHKQNARKKTVRRMVCRMGLFRPLVWSWQLLVG